MNCEICQDPFNHFNKKPHVLIPCIHTFCNECIEKFHEKACPSCRQQFRDIKPNWSILTLIPDSSIDIHKSEFDKFVSECECLIDIFQSNSKQKILANKGKINNLHSQIFAKTNELINKVLNVQKELLNDTQLIENMMSQKLNDLITKAEIIQKSFLSFKNQLTVGSNDTNLRLLTKKLSFYICGFKYNINELNEIHQEFELNAKYSFDFKFVKKLTAAEYYNEAIQLKSLSKYTEAIDRCSESLKLNPYFSSAHSLKGICLYNIEKYYDALECCNNAIKINSKIASYHTGKGKCFFKMNKFEKAIKCFDQSIELKSNDANVFYLKGNCFVELQKYKEALMCYFNSIKIDDKNSNVYNSIGNCYSKMKISDKALNYYSESLKLVPYDPFTYYLKASTYEELKDFKTALKLYDTSIDLDSKREEVFMAKGQCLIKINQFYSAIENFEICINLNSKNVKALIHKGDCQIELNRFDEALASYAKAIEIDPTQDLSNNKFRLNIKKGCQFYHKKSLIEALTCLNEAIKLKTDSECYHLIGLCHIELHSYEKSIECFNKSIALNSSKLELQEDKGQALMKLKKYQEAIICFKQTNPINYQLIFECLFQLDKLDSVLKLTNILLNRNETNAMKYLMKNIEQLMLKNEFQKAIQLIDETNQLDKLIPIWRSICLIELKQYQKAVHYLFETIANNHKVGFNSAYFNLMNVCLVETVNLNRLADVYDLTINVKRAVDHSNEIIGFIEKKKYQTVILYLFK